MTHHFKSSLLKSYEAAVRGAAPKPNVIPITDAMLHPRIVSYRENGVLLHMERCTLIDWLNEWSFVSVIDTMGADYLNTIVWLYLCDMKRQAQPFKESYQVFEDTACFSLPHSWEVLAATHTDPSYNQDIPQHHDTDANAYAVRNNP